MTNDPKLKMLLAYRKGTASLSRLSKALGLSVGETMDFLAELGLKAPLRFDDYRAGAKTARRAIH